MYTTEYVIDELLKLYHLLHLQKMLYFKFSTLAYGSWFTYVFLFPFSLFSYTLPHPLSCHICSPLLCSLHWLFCSPRWVLFFATLTFISVLFFFKNH